MGWFLTAFLPTPAPKWQPLCQPEFQLKLVFDYPKYVTDRVNYTDGIIAYSSKGSSNGERKSLLSM